MAEKMTKAKWFEEIKEVVMAAECEHQEEMIEFIDKQIELLETKAEKAKERAAKTKAEGDALRDAVEALLTGEFQSADEITAQLEGEDITKAKVVARLTQLVRAEIADKEQMKDSSGRKVMFYKLK